MKATFVDAFLEEEHVVVWLRANNQNYFLQDEFHPKFYATGPHEELIKLADALCESFPRESFRARLSKGRDFASKNWVEALEIQVMDFRNRFIFAEFVSTDRFRVELFNVDIPFEQLYLFEKKIRPLEEVEFFSKNDWIQKIAALEFQAFIEPNPKLILAELEVISKGNPMASLDCEIEAIRLNKTFFRGKETNLLAEFKKSFEELDPDVLITWFGNSWMLDYLKSRMELHGIEYDFGRFPDRFRKKNGSSYFSYGRVVHRDPFHALKGRIHIEANGFHYMEAGLHGIFEIAYSTLMPISQASYKSSGTCVSNLYLYGAHAKKILIPVKKNGLGKFQTAKHLFEIDKGGLVFEPKMGIHENVAELDFSSLYPSIMVHHNISPETVCCDCCPTSNRVPETAYNVCEKKVGLIPEMLKTLLERRLYFKKLKSMTEGKEKKAYQQKCNGLKWLLVTSFGYTGYKNARFGRIEAHESICAHGRDKLLTAAHLAEEAGFEIVHGIVDAIYIQKKNLHLEEIEKLIEKIQLETGVEIVLEGIFNWIVFLPSVQNNRIATPGKFYGTYSNGEVKSRGIAVRRRDTPIAIRKMQSEQLEILAKARTIREFDSLVPLVERKLRDWVSKLENQLIPFEELAISSAVSKRLMDYTSDCTQRTVLWQLKQKGINVFAGESVRFVHTKAGGSQALNRVRAFSEKITQIDTIQYAKLMTKATYELLSHKKINLVTMTLAGQGIQQATLNEFEKVKEAVVGQ